MTALGRGGRALVVVLVALALWWTLRASHEAGHLTVVRPALPERVHVLDRDFSRSTLPSDPVGAVTDLGAVVGSTPGGGSIHAVEHPGRVPLVIYVVTEGQATAYALVGGP